jgi:hypothetical protein
MKNFTFLVVASLFLIGCVNNFQKFYIDNASDPNFPSSSLIPTVGEPELIQGSNDKALDSSRMSEDGYISVGYSSFYASGDVTRENLLAQAKKVGAAKVIYYQEYMDTQSGVMPLTLPNTQTTYHSGSVSAYGNGGNAYGSYNGSSTTYGTSTSYIPYSRDRFEYGATYWVKMKMPVLGVQVRDPNLEERTAAGTNKGAVVVLSIKGGPAFEADMLPGDLVIKINDNDVVGFQDLIRMAGKNRGQLVDFEIIRAGKIIHKKIQLNN